MSNTTVYWKINRDFGKWPLNGGWPLNMWPLNRGWTVSLNFMLESVDRNGRVNRTSWGRGLFGLGGVSRWYPLENCSFIHHKLLIHIRATISKFERKTSQEYHQMVWTGQQPTQSKKVYWIIADIAVWPKSVKILRFLFCSISSRSSVFFHFETWLGNQIYVKLAFLLWLQSTVVLFSYDRPNPDDTL